MKVSVFAFRNLTRNRRRTFIAVGSTAFAATIMIVYGALMDGMMFNLMNNITDVSLGHAQIHHQDYRDDVSIYNSIDDYESIQKKLEERKIAGSHRLYAFALGASKETSSGIQITGLDPLRESKVTTIHKYISQGSWLENSDPHGVVIGKSLAKQLSVEIGDEIIVLGQAADGSMANDIYRVRGILKAMGAAIDRGGFYMIEASFRQLILMEKGVHEIVIKPLWKDPVLEDVGEKVKLAAAGYEVKTWKEIIPIMAEMVEMMDISMLIMFGITYFALGLLLVNSCLMSVFERIREFGVLKALGMGPWRITSLILVETFWQTLAACVLALVIGIPSAYYLQSNPIDLTLFTDKFAFSGIAMEPYWFAKVSFKRIIQPVLFLIIIILVSSLYPAIKASVIDPVRAIYHR